MKCYTGDGAELVKKKVEYTQLGIVLGKFDALVCPQCGETFFEWQASKQIENKARELGIWGLARKTRVGTSGSSLDVKLPKPIAEFLNVKKGQEVLIAPVDRKKVEITIL